MTSYTIVKEQYKDKVITSEKYDHTVYNCLFENVTYDDCQFTKCNFSNCTLEHVIFSNCVFTDCMFFGSLENIYFTNGCSFEAFNTFYSCIGKDIYFTDTDIDNLRFDSVMLLGLNFNNSTINMITFNESTINKCIFNNVRCGKFTCFSSLICKLFLSVSKIELFDAVLTYAPSYTIDTLSTIKKIAAGSVLLVKDIDIYGSFLTNFLRDCPLTENNTRIVYRSEASLFRHTTVYEPGEIYTADLFSWDTSLERGPGIYASSANWLYSHLMADIRYHAYNGVVQCSVEDGDWIMTLTGAIRTKKLTVLKRFSIKEFEAILQID